eukprot:3397005-Amphidinium_carterae.1
MRQGGMPHIPTEVVRAFRVALRQTRKESRVFLFEDWEELLGSLIPFCETVFSVQEDDIDVHGKSSPASTETHVESSSAEVDRQNARDDKLVLA